MTFRRLAYLASVAGLCAMSGGMTVSALPKGNDAPLTFRLRDSAGIQHSDLELRPARAVVLLFITPDCPISQGYVPEMNRIANEFRAKGVTVFGVQADVTARREAFGPTKAGQEDCLAGTATERSSLPSGA